MTPPKFSSSLKVLHLYFFFKYSSFTFWIFLNVGTFNYWEKLKESIKNMKNFYYGFFHLNIDVTYLNVK